MKKYLWIIFLSGLIFPLLGMSDPEVEAYFRRQNIRVNIHYDSIGEHNVRSIETFLQDNSGPLIVFIHGAGSDGMKFRKLMSDTSLLARARLVTVDRPGYGASTPGLPLPGIRDQACVVERVLSRYSFTSCLVVAHSYGCAIAATFVAEHPELNLRLIMLAPAIDPELEKVYFISKMAMKESVNWLLPEKTRVAGAENRVHRSELQNILSVWKELKVPVCHIHGLQDRVIPYQNIYFSQKSIGSEYLQMELWPHIGHYLVILRRKQVTEKIKALLPEGKGSDQTLFFRSVDGIGFS